MDKIRSAAQEAFERQILETGAPLVEQWKPYLDAPAAPPVTDPYARLALARMLETQKKILSIEALQTTSVFGANYVPAMLGMTRQVFPRMFGTRLVATQPMDRPSGDIFHLKVTRDDGSSLGVRPQDSAAGWGFSKYQESKTYADHANGEGGAIDKGMALSITKTSVAINDIKKLKTEASWENMTDLAAVHGLDVMNLLQGAATDEIAQEWDAMLVAAVRAAAIANLTVTFGTTPGSGTWTNGEWSKRIQRAILNADMGIFKRSQRRPDVMVCGIDAYAELLDLSGFKLSPNQVLDGGNYGLVPVGTLNNQYEVMLSRHIPDNEIILGRRGSGFLDAGVVWAPYVPLFVSERFFDVSTQRSVQSFASRAEIVTVSNLLYARVVIDPNATGIV